MPLFLGLRGDLSLVADEGVDRLWDWSFKPSCSSTAVKLETVWARI